MDIQETKNKLAALKKEYRDTAQKAFKDSLKTFLDKYSFVDAIMWTQYTPYFNDGDTCLFSVHDVEIKGDPRILSPDLYVNEDVSSVSVLEYTYCEETIVNYLKNKTNKDSYYKEKFVRAPTIQEKEFLNDCEELFGLIHSLEDSLQSILGEGLVTVTKDGISVTDWDHS